MNNIDYKHKASPSLMVKLLNNIFSLIWMKRLMEKRMIDNAFVKNPAKLPKSFYENFTIRVSVHGGRKVWTIAPVNNSSDTLMLYLHGGAYMGNIRLEHWQLIEQLIVKTKSVVVIPDYPLAPEATCSVTYGFIGDLYLQLLTNFPAKQVIFIGDSAGGGLALGFGQQLRNEKLKLPSQIIIFSPWLDLTLTNPELQLFTQGDNLLSITGLQCAARFYAGNLDLKDYRLSPLYGDLSGLCRISVFTGTNDLLHADARRFRQLMNEQKLGFNYFEYPGLFHDWVIITRLKETTDVIGKVYNLVNEYE